ncbi:MAG: glycosyltransferase [Porcipelethomonas sp.]
MHRTILLIYFLIGCFYLIYMTIYAAFLFASVITGALGLYKEKRKRIYESRIYHEYYVPVSVIIPAHNEEITVVDTVRSVLSLDYKLYEIIIVDDGSCDNTCGVLIETFNMKEIKRPVIKKIDCRDHRKIYESVADGVKITLAVKEQGGKADALNMGINLSNFPYIICMDADTVLQRDSVKQIVAPVLEDESVVAVGGLVRISNGVILKNGEVAEYHMPGNPLVGMQILEYDRSFMASRIFLDRFNGNLIISGAFGLFKKDIVISAGGYDCETVGEDMELVVRLHSFCRTNQINYSVKYVPEAVCWSQCPSDLKGLKIQRRRWFNGLFQCLHKHRRIFMAEGFGAIGYISYLYYLLYEFLAPYIEAIGIITIASACATDIINMPFMIAFMVIYIAYGAVLTMTAFLSRIYLHNISISLTDVLKAAVFCIAESFFLRFIHLYIRVTAFISYRKRKNQWGCIKRKKYTNAA